MAFRPLFPCGRALKPRLLIVLAFDLVSPVRRQSSARLHAWGSSSPPASAAISSGALSTISCRSSHLSLASIALLSPAHWQYQLRRRGAARWPFFVDRDWSSCCDYSWLESPGANSALVDPAVEHLVAPRVVQGTNRVEQVPPVEEVVLHGSASRLGGVAYVERSLPGRHLPGPLVPPLPRPQRVGAHIPQLGDLIS
jgi:hypothetical protein